MSDWRPSSPQYSISCPFERDVPEPPCGVCGEPDCDDCDGFVAVESCGRDPAVRVQLSDGTYLDACSHEAHGYAPVLWWAPLHYVKWQPLWTDIMKYYYRDEFIVAAVNRECALLKMLKGEPPAAVEFNYEVDK